MAAAAVVQARELLLDGAVSSQSMDASPGIKS
jgi:hypothetical protein